MAAAHRLTPPIPPDENDDLKGWAPLKSVALMDRGSVGEGLHGLDAKELAQGERVLHHWPAPGGIGLLTDRRCFLLGHPRPIHRPIHWVAALREVQSIEVEQIGDTVVPGRLASSPTEVKGVRVQGWSGTMTMASLPGNFMVIVDGVRVFTGYPGKASEVQGWIDEACSRLIRSGALNARPDLA